MADYNSIDDFRAREGYEIDGVWYPRVTAIVSIKAKPALYRYYASMPSFRAADEAKEQSAIEGAAVHEAAEAMLAEKDPVIPAEIRPSLEAFSSFLQNHHVTPLLIEERIKNKEHQYAGTIDVLAEVDGTIGVLDIKTSKYVYRDYGMQTAAYVAALRERKDIPPPQTSWILRLDQKSSCNKCGASLRQKGGNTKVRGGISRCSHQWSPMQGEFEFHEVQEYEHNFQAFLAAKKLWEWENAEWLR
ncbi:MAG: hypothetical protein UT84_C0028G0006 [Candidatus Curtissbacteria bacterium GW2011_GWA1_40_16]|uniref:PD-(D/E)XK endonuclease-like domain-containing protein n=1 Tax=Candidatus Curtissbacteria bacterium GW2011_GWA1_40_16 TaxID=1618405 RepID=A0A0G0UGY2_9BACT|nr:MAG: hypothetical protein UT84_C0028G0006 [Candidatus Curtissbacteria bacterium GW2011_GWA1_40_16]